MTTRLDRMPEWQSLKRHAGAVKNRRIEALFERDAGRFQGFGLSAAGLYLDYSKQNIDARTRELLLALARASELTSWRDRLFAGDRINITEDRAVLHTALRGAEGDAGSLTPRSVLEEVRGFRDRMSHFVGAVLGGQWRGHTGKPVSHVINIGIGGSDLGPAMVCRALSAHNRSGLDIRFVSNIDPAHLKDTLTRVDPESTLFVLASKTFTTAETMANARAARQWVLDAMGDSAAVQNHFVAVTSRPGRAREFGIDDDNIFPMADWIGGRYSLWSTIGIPIALQLGMTGFRQLLGGAAEMDSHFLAAPLERNMPVLMAMIGIWNRNFRDAGSLAVVPYAQRLELLPAYLQQLEMESNGKTITRHGEAVGWDTCPVIWGAAGTNGQHAFFQQLHQGTSEVPVDFIIVRQPDCGDAASHRMLLANAVAQSAALMRGRKEPDVRARLEATGASTAEVVQQVAHRVYPGNRPSSTIILDTLGPRDLGALLALYEHKTFVQGVVWQICSFDQWGVELGKELAGEADALLRGEGKATAETDPSTIGLLGRLRADGE